MNQLINFRILFLNIQADFAKQVHVMEKLISKTEVLVPARKHVNRTSKK